MVDPNNEAIEFANIYLKQDTFFVDGTFSDEKGEFILNAPTGNYQLHIDFIGFKSYSDTISLSRDIKMENVMLEVGGENLDELVISEFRNEVKAGIDKKVVYVSESLRKSNSNVSQLLEMVPLVNMDFDGNPSVPGKIGTVILVDGREPKIRANDLATVLRLIPSDQVVAIEIMTNPPAKYTKTNAAVINIVTNKRPQKGSLVNLWSRYNDLGAKTFSGNFTYKNGNFSSSLWAGRWEYRNKSNYNSSLTNINEEELYLIQRSSESDYRGHGVYAGWAPEFEVNNKFIVSPYLGYYEWNNDNNSEEESNIYSRENILTNSYDILDNSLYSGKGYYAGLELFKYFDEEEKELTFDVGVELFKFDNFSENTLNRSGETQRQREDNNSKNNSLDIDLEFFDPIDSTSSYSLDFEFEYEFPNEVVQDFFVGSMGTHLVKDEAMSYINEEGSMTQEFSVSYSKRFENTSLAFDLGQVYFKYDNIYDQTTVVDNDYLFLVPKISLNQKLTSTNEIGLSYKYGNEVPNAWFLNPNIRTSVDGLDIRYGNANLEPERSHEVELNYGFYLGKFNIGSTAFWRKNVNTISSFNIVNDDGIKINTYQNNGTLTNAGVQVSLSGSLSQLMRINVGGSFYDSRQNRDGIELSTASYNINSRIDISAPWDLKLSLNGRYNGPELSIQGKSEGNGIINANIRKSFLNDRLNLTLRYTDILRSQEVVSDINAPNFSLNSVRKSLPAQFGAVVTYRMGNLKEKPRSTKSQ